MKKRVVAVVLSVTLCMATVLQTGAAVFDDQAEPEVSTALDSAVFDDSLDGPQQPEVPPVDEPAEVTPTPEIFETVTPAPEVPEETPVPEVPGEELDAPEEDAADMDIFTAGESAQEPGPTKQPDQTEIEGEFLNAAAGKIFVSNWKTIDGKWKLAKPAPANLAASSDNETAGVPAEQTEAVFTEETAENVPADLLTVGTEEGVSEETAVQEENTEPSEQTGVPEEAENSEADILNAASEPEYYTSKDGIVHIQTYQSVGNPNTLITEGDYYFDEEGFLVTGQRTLPAGTPGFSYTTAKEAYFMPEENATLNNPNSTGACTPVNSNMGKLQRKYWLWTGKTFRYYSSNGGFLSVATLKRENLKKNTYTGYYTINNERYILKSDGTPCVGDVTIKDGKAPGRYYGMPAKKEGEIPGKLFRSGWMKVKDSKGVLQWRKYLSDGRYWSHKTTTAELPCVSGKIYTYLLDSNGYVLKSKMAKAQDGYYYITNKYGQVYKNKLVTYKGARYYVTSSGKRSTYANGWYRVSPAGKRYYYFGKTPGKVVEKKGWQLVVRRNGTNAGWFYFSSKGNHYIDKLTGGRYFRPDGRLASGITTVNGKTYFFQGSTAKAYKGVMYKNTWISYKSKWYYAGSDGVLYKSGWKSINGNYYYFNKDYTVKTNCSATRNGVRGYLDSRGKFCTGWVIVNDAKNQVKYVNPKTGKFAVNCSLVINGLRYYFDKNGYRINDLTGRFSGPYYLVADRVNGVMTVYDSSRTVPIKTIRISVGLSSTPTWPANRDMRLTSYNRWQTLMGPSWGQYGTHVDGAGNGGIFIHSVAGVSKSYYNLPAGEYNRLGSPASHGCIRCCVADARWVFYNCNGSTIRIIDGTYNANESFKGPLGRKALVPLYGSRNFDPTDNLAWH